MERRGVAKPDVFGRGAKGGEELGPDGRIGDVGWRGKGLATVFGGEVVIGGIEVS